MNEKSILQGLVTPALIALAFAAGFSTHWAMVRTSSGAAPSPLAAKNDLPAEPVEQKPDQFGAPAVVVVEPPASADKPPTPTPQIDVWPGRHLFVEVDGQWLSQPTKDLIREIRPGGVLLRTENIDSVTQTLGLVREIKEAAGIGRRQMSDLPIVALALTERAAFDMLAGATSQIVALASASSVDPAREMGRTLAGALREHGINALLGPVLDVGGPAPTDSAYQTRVISRDRIVTAAMGLAETDELLRAGIVCAVTTFPGYSAAARGPLRGLVLAQDTMELAELLYPFSAAAANGVPGIVVGHVAVPAVDDDFPKRLASQSPVLVGKVLRGLWSFDGVVVGDDVTSALLGAESTPGAAAVEAIAAGCDAVIVGSADFDVVRAVCTAISGAVADGKLNESALKDGKRRLDAWIARLESPTGLEGILPQLPDSLLRVAKAENEAAPAVSPRRSPVAQEVTQVEAPALSFTTPPSASTPDSELKLPESGKLEEAQGEYQAVQSPAAVVEQPPGVVAVETTPAQLPSPPEPSPSELVVAAQPEQANDENSAASSVPETVAPVADTVADASAPAPEETGTTPADASPGQTGSELTPAVDQPTSEQVQPREINSTPPLSTEIHREVVPAAIGDPTIVPDVAQMALTDAEAEAAGQTEMAPEIAPGEKTDANAVEIKDTVADAAANPSPLVEIPKQPSATPIESPTPEVERSSAEPSMAPPSEIEMTHMVLPGETIMEIATKYEVQASDIQAWNDLANLNVEFGKALKLRVRPEVAERIRAEESQRPPAEFQESAHVVAAGETLTSIAAAYGVQIRDLVRWNGLTDSRLQVGNELKVYRGPGAETIEAPKPATTTYQVKKGDTLTQISRRFGVTPQEILKANNLDDPNKVIVGQRLTIPVKD